jgi:hypothetical protein
MKSACISAVLLALLLGGCMTNDFTKFYHDYTAGTSRSDLFRNLQPFSGTTQIVLTNDLEKDTTELLRRNYAVLGESAFAWNQAPAESELRAQARLVGADVVLYRTQVQVFSTAAMPETNWTTESSLPAHRYAYDALYLRKRTAPVAGLGIANLTDEMRETLRRNKGVIVRYVRYDSPASKAGFLEGDVIIAINDVQVDSATDYIDKALKVAGSECRFKVLRGGTEIEIPIRLGPSSAPASKPQ